MFTDNRTTGRDGRPLLQPSDAQLQDIEGFNSRYAISIPEPAQSLRGHLSLGTNRAPDGGEIGIDSLSLFRHRERWLPAMGEFHYARYPCGEWRDELIKMKACGIGIVASYVFWIHHEEVEGAFEWQGSRSLRDFTALCRELGLLAVVRCGPWCHGEVRNGGLPDWVLAKCREPRSDDPVYLGCVRRLFREIAGQLEGLLWKNGGPVIGIQCENEYHGAAEHLLTLKRIVQSVGIDVPIYTRTGWPEIAAQELRAEYIPLFGGYPDGFWDRSVEEMPAGYRDNYLFGPPCGAAAVAVTDQEGMRGPASGEARRLYPFLSCEIGGGMMTSYHRRIRIAPRDIESLAIAKIGSGNNLQGYYMFHGGTNPQGRLSTLQESQATGYWNDLPVKTYDFQAPLGEFGQVREHFHRLRRLHLFLNDFGRELAGMPVNLPEDRPARANDTGRLRWSVRSNGKSGFVFVNNYQRLQPMPAKQDVQFEIWLGDHRLCFPHEPSTVAADSCFAWPFHLDMDGAYLVWATAQPICRLEVGEISYYFFGETPGVPAEFVFDPRTATVDRSSGSVSVLPSGVSVRRCRPGTQAAIELRSAAGRRVCIVLLDDAQSLACWKQEYLGRERIFLTKATPLIDGTRLRLQAADAGDLSASVLPALDGVPAGAAVESQDGIFRRYSFHEDLFDPGGIGVELLKHAGQHRAIRMGSQGVAEAPVDGDFEDGAAWQLALPRLETAGNPMLCIRYAGDVARLYLNGNLIADNFYNGSAWEVGLARFLPDIARGELVLIILPLSQDAPIYLPSDAWPDFRGAESTAQLMGIDLMRTYEAGFDAAGQTTH